MYELFQAHPELSRMKGLGFFHALEDIIRHGEPEKSELAKAVMFLSLQRKEIVYLAEHRISGVICLAKAIGIKSRIIIFGERISTAKDIYCQLSQIFPNEVGIYHSKIPKYMGTHTLRQFKDSDIRILVTCRTLDEGLNVSETDIGIVVSSTGSRRQRVQRLGRVLRKKKNAAKAKFFYLFIEDTVEEEELLKEMTSPKMQKHVKRIDLRFDPIENRFTNDHHEKWLEIALEDKKSHTTEELTELKRNAYKGLLSEDWLTTENDCLEKIKNSANIAERNYFIAMLLLIRARS
jgi:superfamily II DNA or RNA helicase